MKKLLSGNEALARGAWEAGVRAAFGYPGTPSTEILENLVKYDGPYCEWSPNEKVAMEAAAGAAIGGARSMVTMKLVGPPRRSRTRGTMRGWRSCPFWSPAAPSNAVNT